MAAMWPLVVLYYYLQEHDYALLLLKNFYFWNFVVFWLLVYLGTLAYRLLLGRELTFTWQTKPWKVLFFLLLFLTVASSLFMFRSGILTQVPVELVMWNLFLKLSSLILVLLVLSFWTISLGNTLLTRLRLVLDTKLETYLLSLGLGLSFLSLLCFSLALLGLLKLSYLLPLLLLILLLVGHSAWKVWSDFRGRTISLSLNLKSLEPFFLGLFLTILVLHVLSLLRPVSIGWDGLAGYMNNAQLLASRGELLSGVNSYAYELIMSIGFLLSSNASLSLALASLIVLPVMFLIYGGVKKVASSSTAALTALLFYTIPLVLFHAEQESKVDLASVFWVGLSLICFYYFWRERSLKFLSLSAFLAGFAFSIKYTNLFLIIALCLTLLAGFYLFRPWKFKQVLLSLGCFVLFVALPFSPWAAWNMWSGGVNFYALASGAYSGPGIACSVPATSTPLSVSDDAKLEHESTKIDQVFNFSGYREEIGRYLGYGSGWTKYLLTPWTLTMNKTVSGLYVDLGFLFLSLIPLALLYALLYGFSRPWRLLALFTIFYWLTWLIFARGIIWYAMPGFLPLLLFIGKFYHKGLADKWGNLALQFLLVINVLVGLNSAMIGYGHPADIAYATGLFDEQLYIDNTLPSYRAIYEKINAGDGNVYRMGTFIKYFIKDNDRRVFTDDQMDTIACLIQSNSPEEVLSKLRQAGFRYLVLDLNIPTIDQTPEQSLTKKFELVRDFLKQHTKVVLNEEISRNKILFSEI